MPEKQQPPKAIIIGATSGIGESLARMLSHRGWIVGLAGRRSEKLVELAQSLPNQAYFETMDVMQPESAVPLFERLIETMQGMDVLIISAGISRRGATPQQEQEIIRTNVSGFTVLARRGFEYFSSQKKGHLVGISSISAIRGRAENLAYSASKAYMSNYLQGLRQKAFRMGLPIAVTDVLAGWVDTPLIRGSHAKHFWVAPVEKAGHQIIAAITKRKNKVYITRRWRLIGWFLTLIPDAWHKRL